MHGLTEDDIAFAMRQGPPAYRRGETETYRAILPDGRHMKVSVRGEEVQDAFTHQPPTGG